MMVLSYPIPVILMGLVMRPDGQAQFTLFCQLTIQSVVLIPFRITGQKSKKKNSFLNSQNGRRLSLLLKEMQVLTYLILRPMLCGSEKVTESPVIGFLPKMRVRNGIQPTLSLKMAYLWPDMPLSSLELFITGMKLRKRRIPKSFVMDFSTFPRIPRVLLSEIRILLSVCMGFLMQIQY